MSSNSLFTALEDFWRVDNKHGLYPQRNIFNIKIKYSGVIYFLLTITALAVLIILSAGAL